MQYANQMFNISFWSHKAKIPDCHLECLHVDSIQFVEHDSVFVIRMHQIEFTELCRCVAFWLIFTGFLLALSGQQAVISACWTEELGVEIWHE